LTLTLTLTLVPTIGYADDVPAITSRGARPLAAAVPAPPMSSLRWFRRHQRCVVAVGPVVPVARLKWLDELPTNRPAQAAEHDVVAPLPSMVLAVGVSRSRP
jgi:hypothetical protein